MSKLSVFLLSYASIICGYGFQVLHNESDDYLKDIISTSLSWNNSSDGDNYEDIYSEIDSLINSTASLGINLDFLPRNESETEMLYAPAFSLELQDYENDTKNLRLNENAQNTVTFSSNLTNLRINGNVQTTIHNESNFFESSTLNNSDSYFINNTNQAALKSTIENELNFTQENDNHISENSSAKLNISELQENESFITHCPVFIPHSLTHKIDIKFSILNKNMQQRELLPLFEILLRQALHETKCESLVLLSLIHGTYFVYSWTNASISSEYCDAMLADIEEKIFNQSKLSNTFRETFLPLFRIENITILRLGICAVDRPTEQDDNNGVIAIIVVCALILLPCFFLACFKFIHYKKCKARKTETVLKSRLPMVLESDNFTAKSHGPTTVNLAFENDIEAEQL